MSTKLPNYLWPKGRSTTEPDMMPNVQDSDGNAVLFTSAKRKTTEGTVVDLGDSPNSNNGDPLRTAFAKVNNFIEAAYWWDEGINQKFRDIDSELNEGVSFYTDSDERYSISMLGDSKFYFRGKENQIELNVTKKHSPNNLNDWDSEVSLYFQLAHTLETYNVNVNEFFTIRDSDGIDRVTYRSVDYPTTYNERPQNGRDVEFNIGTNVVLGRDSDDVVVVNGRVASNLIPYGDEIYNLGDSDNKWRDLYLSGNTIYLGSIQIKNLNNRGLVLVDSDGQTLDLTIHSGRASTLQVDSDMLVDGLTQLLGDLTVRQNARFDSDVSIFGNLTVGDDISTNGKVSIREGLTVDSDVVFSADLRVDSDLIVKGTSVFGQQMVINDTLNVSGHATFDSDVTISGTVTASSFKTTNPAGLTFEDDVVFQGHATFDSDVNFSRSIVVDSDIIVDGVSVKNKFSELDSEIAVTRSDLDSDSKVLQQHDSDIRNLRELVGEGNEYVLAALDSDVAILTANQDSDYRNYMDHFYWTWDRIDSESVKVQQLKTDFEDIILDNPVVTDSERPVKAGKVPILNSIARFDKSVMPLDVPLTVNGVQPDLNQNIVLNITATGIGARDDRADSEVDGFVFIVDSTDSDSGTANDASGTLYIYSDDARSWQRIVGFTAAENDIRYVNVTGDTMVGPLYLAADPVGVNESSNKHYVDALDSDQAVLTASLQTQITDNDSDILYLQTFIDGGSF